MTNARLISVIIPALNEKDEVGSTVERVREQAGPVETIVVDGGSTDGTRSAARAAGGRVVRGSRGRAEQMNRGVESASGDILLFLHADTHLAAEGLTLIRKAVREPPVVGGTFQLQFDDPTPLLRFYAWCTRWPWIRLCFGDRGQFVTRPAFEAVGGFPEWPLFEDLEFAARLDGHGEFRFLNSAVTTSARRFHRNGALRQQLRNVYLWTHYMIGTNPDRLVHLYES